MFIVIVLVLIGILLFISLYILSLRRIVPTNEVHIVQRETNTISYGKSTRDKVGNAYYQLPTWVPKYGIVVSKLPSTIIDIDIQNFDVYDKERKQFSVDIKGFFKIVDFNLAANRIFTISDLKQHLEIIIKCATSNVLTDLTYDNVLSRRKQDAEKLTKIVEEQLVEWGVQPVINIELLNVKEKQGEK